MRVFGARDRQDFRYAVQCRRLRGNRIRRIGHHQDVDGIRLDFTRARDAASGCRVEPAVQVFGNDQYLAHVTPVLSV
jgi:hypothetical protein